MNRGEGDGPRGSYRQRGFSDDAGAYDNRPPSWRRGPDGDHPDGGDDDWNRRRPAYDRGGRGHFPDRERDGPNEPRDRFQRNSQVDDAPPSARRDRAGSYDKAAGNSTPAESGWTRGARPAAGGDVTVAKDKLKVNQVNTTLLRPNREIVVATNLTSGSAMKVLTKQSASASASGGEVTATTSTENTPVPPVSAVAADAASSVDRDHTDAFSKSFASLLSQFKDKNSSSTGGAGANASRPRESDRSPRDVDHLEDERGNEDDERGQFRDRRRRVDDADADGDYSHRNYSSRRYRDDYGEDDGYGGRYGGRPPRGGRDFDYRERDGDYGYHGYNDARGRFHHDQHGSYGRPSGPPGPPPPRRKGGMLYEPKSGQFVEDREKEAHAREELPAGGRGRKHSEGSASQGGADAGDRSATIDRPLTAEKGAPAESAAPESATPAPAPTPAEPRWSRVSVIKRALAEESGLKDPAPALESKEKKTPSLTKEQLEEQRRLRVQEEQRIRRTQERLQRGPRTKGQLFRFSADGRIEEAAASDRVWDEALRESLEAVVGVTSSKKKSTKDLEVDKPSEAPVEPEVVVLQVIDAKEAVESSVGAPPPLTASLPLEAVDESTGAESIGGEASGVPSTPRLSELAATASVFTPSQPLLASLQQAQQQSLPSLAYPGLIMTGAGAETPTAPSNPLASTTPMQTAPPPPMFMSSPGMTNMLFGQQATSAASMPDMFAHHGTFAPMNALGMNTLGTINAFNAMNFQAQLPHHLASHQHAYGMMPGMIMDTSNSAASSMQSIYGYDPRFSANGNVVGGLGWNSAAATAPATGAAGIGMLSDSTGTVAGASGGSGDQAAAALQGGAKDVFAGAGATGTTWGYGAANASGLQRGSSGGVGQAGNSTLYGGGEDFYYGVASSGAGNSGAAGFFPAGSAGSDGGMFKVNGMNMGFFSGGGNANVAMMGDMFFAPSGSLAQQQMLQQQQQQQQMQLLQQQQMLQQQQQAQAQQQSGQPVAQSTGPEASGALIADASGRSPAIGGAAADGSTAGATASPASQQLAPPAQGGVVPVTLPMATSNGGGAVNSGGGMGVFDMSGIASTPFMADQSMGGEGYLYGNQRFTQQGYNQFGAGGYGGYNAPYGGNFNSNNANNGGRGYRNNHGGGYGGNNSNNYYTGGDAYANAGNNYNNNYGGAGAQYHAAPGGFTQRRNNNNSNNNGGGNNNNINGNNGGANGNNPMYYNAYSN